MPRLSRWFIRAALVYLALGFSLGGLLLANKGVPLGPWVWRLLPAHVEFMLPGWTLQLAMGVGFWILPRFRGSRGDETPAWMAFFLLNLGVLVAGVGPTVGASSLVSLLGRLGEVAGSIAFAIQAWPRVKPLGM
jgi:hypothetical protein